MKTYGFARKEHPRIVTIWAERRGDRFWVINGLWRMCPTQDHFIEVWSGQVPPPHSYDYNEAINWIQKQVDGPLVVVDDQDLRDADDDPCPECGTQLEAQWSGVKCPSSDCGYWFCH
jgi:hypothetical protein